MKIRTHYNRIDRVVYEFDENDIRDALITKAKLRWEQGKRIEFEIDIDADGKVTVIITQVWETPGGYAATADGWPTATTADLHDC